MDRIKAEATMAAYKVGGIDAVLAMCTKPEKTKAGETVGRWETEALAAAFIAGWDVVDIEGNADYQGWGVLLLKSTAAAHGDDGITLTRVVTVWGVLAWSYGTCSHCDPFEGMEPNEIIESLQGSITMYTTEEAARLALDGAKGW